MLGTRVKEHLVGKAGLLENLLGLVALLGREDLISLGSGDGQGAGDGGKLVLVDERGVGEVADVNAVLVVTGDVLRDGVGGLAHCTAGKQMRERSG